MSSLSSSSSPFDVPLVRDLILEYVGTKYARQLRQVSHAWNNKAMALFNDSNDSDSGGWTVRVSLSNISDICSPVSLLRRGRPGSTSLAIDFGSQPTRAEFQLLIEQVTNLICAQGQPDIPGRGSDRDVKSLIRCGLTPEMDTAKDLLDLIKFLVLVGPGLRFLYLTGSIRHRVMYHDDHGNNVTRVKLAPLPGSPDVQLWFPNLKFLVQDLYGPGNLLLDILEPDIVPELTRVRLKASQEDVDFGMWDDELNILLFVKLQQLPNLSELSLDVTDLSHIYHHENLPPILNVRSLTLHIFRKAGGSGYPGRWSGRYLAIEGGRVECKGNFIGSVFPQLIALRLKYDARLAQLDTFYIPREMQRLEYLRSLSYCLKGPPAAPIPNGWWRTTRNEEVVQIRRMKLHTANYEQLQTMFPLLQEIVTDLGFELTLDSGPNQIQDQLCYPAVTKLQLRTGRLCPDLGLELEECAHRLCQLYPNVSHLALDASGSEEMTKSRPFIDPHTRALLVAGTLIEKFDLQPQAQAPKLKGLELLNYSANCVAQLLLLPEKGPRNGIRLRGLRQMTLKLVPTLAIVNENSLESQPCLSCQQLMPSTGPSSPLTLRLSNLAAQYPELELLQVNEEPLARASGCSVGDIYAEAFDLQRKRANLKIRLN